MIADKAIDVKDDVKPEYIDAAGRLLNKVFADKTIEDIKHFDVKESDAEIKGFKDIFDEVLSILRMYINEHSSDNVFVEGALKMLDYPEYQNIDDAKQFLSVISDKDAVSEIILGDDSSIEFTVRIGKEDSGVDKCAIITAAYKVGDEVQGKAGVIGPERMDYKKVISVLDYVKKMFSSVLSGDKLPSPFDDEE
jgi:heat-inducible transcriptional repressor